MLRGQPRPPWQHYKGKLRFEYDGHKTFTVFRFQTIKGVENWHQFLSVWCHRFEMITVKQFFEICKTIEKEYI